jgi:NAD-reducing hydrogenase small subunit
MSFLDLDERLIELAGLVEVCASPITDYKDFPEVDITLVEGAVANFDHIAHIHEVRARTRILVAFGDCAVTGNVTAMRNYFDPREVIEHSYRDNSLVVVGLPEGNAVVPRLTDRVVPIHEVVPVDYFLPGCPPSADEIYTFVMKLLAGQEPGDQRRFG